MKKSLYRISMMGAVILLGSGIFYLLLFAGDKSAGPLEDLATAVTSGIARAEKKIMGNKTESRESALQWFRNTKSSGIRINHTDTLLMGVYDDNTAESFESIVALEDSLGFHFPIISIYSAWGSKPTQIFPMLRAMAVADLGSLPMITWEPWLNDFNKNDYPPIDPNNPNLDGMKNIASGKYDPYIDKWAEDARKFGLPFLIRFGHEMNDPYRYPWGPQNNKAEDFIAAWQHVVSRFRLKGANNAIWCWSPHPAYHPYAAFYPGHTYVDWLGITTLNYGTVASWSQWWTFDDTFSKCYNELSLYGKPMMLTEFGSLGVGGNKAQWFQQALDALPAKYPMVKSAVFFHNANDNTTTYKSINWSFIYEPEVRDSIHQAIDRWKLGASGNSILRK